MPSPRAVTVSKNALEELSKAAIGFDVRPHELVDPIVVHTNWEVQVEKPVKSSHKPPRAVRAFPESHPESYRVPSLRRVLPEPRQSLCRVPGKPQNHGKRLGKTRPSPSRVREVPKR